MKTISLIIPIFNAREYLEKCLESAVSQDCENMEIICVDDGSTDGSGHILDDFAKKYGKIVAIHQENGGESNARNRGLSAASGEYIGFMDCDDWIEPDMYSRLRDALETYDVDMAASGWSKEFPEQSIVAGNRGQVKHGVINQKELLKYVYYRDDYQGFAYMWNKLYKREIVCNDQSEPFFFDESMKLGGDVLYLAQCALNAKCAVYVDRSFYHYLQRLDSGFHNLDLTKKQDHIRAYRIVLDEFERKHVEPIVLDYVKRMIAYNYSIMAQLAYEQKNRTVLKECQEWMSRYEKEYRELNIDKADWLRRYADILQYTI